MSGSTSEEREEYQIRQERREQRLKKRREQMQRHGGSIVKIYQNAVTKRLSDGAAKKKRGKK